MCRTVKYFIKKLHIGSCHHYLAPLSDHNDGSVAGRSSDEMERVMKRVPALRWAMSHRPYFIAHPKALSWLATLGWTRIAWVTRRFLMNRKFPTFGILWSLKFCLTSWLLKFIKTLSRQRALCKEQSGKWIKQFFSKKSLWWDLWQHWSHVTKQQLRAFPCC